MNEVVDLPVLDGHKVTIICTSDTHNDDPSSSVAEGDIFIHAGDMTDFGTMEELQAAYAWISALKHKIKIVVAGNHDFGLDKNHAHFTEAAVKLFTSVEARANGIQYLDREVKAVARYEDENGKLRPLRVYGNPCQPEFIGKPYAFTYRPDPSAGATEAWLHAPNQADNAAIWIMHSPPLHRLDDINDVYKEMGLRGCGVQASKIASAKPLLSVFGHYHFSWGMERIEWHRDSKSVVKAELLTVSAERQNARDLSVPVAQNEWDFTETELARTLAAGTHTLFVNAAWKTMDKNGAVRNTPFKISLRLPT